MCFVLKNRSANYTELLKPKSKYGKLKKNTSDKPGSVSL